MRWRAEPLAHNIAPLVVAVFLALFLLGPIGVILAHAGGVFSALSPADVAALRFTLTQAAVSSIVSVALAVPVARALARRRFPGRGALIVVMGAPFILPTLVAVVGLLAVFGRNGLFNDALAALGLSRLSPYGFHGVVLAHVFLNLPLATRLILQGHERVPGDHHRLAAALGFGGWARFRHLELPMLAQVVPGALAAIFLICLTSFAVALTLGVDPRRRRWNWRSIRRFYSNSI
jgi:thiamine transport system permease protein